MNNNLVGTSIKVLNDGGEVVKTITIAKARETPNGVIVMDTEGDLYSEDELNWTYSITPEYALYSVINDHFPNDGWNKEFYSKILKEILESFEKIGFIENLKEC